MSDAVKGFTQSENVCKYYRNYHVAAFEMYAPSVAVVRGSSGLVTHSKPDIIMSAAVIQLFDRFLVSL